MARAHDSTVRPEYLLMLDRSLLQYPSLVSTPDDVRPVAKSPTTDQPDGMTLRQRLDLVDSLLTTPRSGLRFPAAFEGVFQTEISLARLHHFVRMGLYGVVAFNSFIFTDKYLLSDIFDQILVVHLLIVSPIVLGVLYAIHRRKLGPEFGTTFCQLLIFGSIIYFYWQSQSELAPFLIFTIPVLLVFGNVVLPLPFIMSAWFTVLVIASSSVAVIMRPGWDTMICVFTMLVNANAGLFMLFGTYRMERSERRAYLFNLRERLRAEMLAENNEELRNLSETDGLTGVANRRHFDGALERLWQTAAQAAEPLALFVVDIDHFKKLNDTFGHQEGDRCLRAVAQCLQAHLMPNAVLARYGGEEFVVLLPGVNELYARSCAEVLRSAVSRLALTSDDGFPMTVTVSIGTAAIIPNPAQRSATLVSAADHALYRAKENGRNRVEGAAAVNDAGMRDLRQTA